jgi:5-methylcytosine-specific restriction enzyme subunit McrC
VTAPPVARTIYPCEEHGEVSVPLADLLVNGELDVYAEVAVKGLFQISHRKGSLVLRATKFIGLIPLSDRVAIHVRPRLPIANIWKMICRAGIAPQELHAALRTYAERPGEIDTPEEFYRSAFLDAIEDLARRGVLKQYQTEESSRGWKGTPSISRSVGRYYARGIHYRHIFKHTRLTADNTPNRILKRYTTRVLDSDLNVAGRQSDPRVKRARGLLQFLGAVDDGQLLESDVLRAPSSAIRTLPPAHGHYEAPLWLAYLIASRTGIVLEEMGRARLESLVVDMSDVFERYVRQIIEDVWDQVFRSRVRNGNVERLRLFREGRDFPIKPDILFERNGAVVALADAKYKPKLSEADRYEVLAYCEATGAKHAALISPSTPGEPTYEKMGKTERFTVSTVRINLGDPNTAAEEKRFCAELATVLGLST